VSRAGLARRLRRALVAGAVASPLLCGDGARRAAHAEDVAAPTAAAKATTPAAKATTPAAKATTPAVIDLPKTPAQLTLDPSWISEPPPALPELLQQPGLTTLVAQYRDGAMVLTVVRFDAPNAAACPPRQLPAAPTTCRGYRRVKRAVSESQGVPAMELQATNDSKATLLFRFLLFRTYTILATIELAPKSGSAPLRRARRALASFVPQPDWRR
jgi:hypothetical protein